MTMNKSYHYLLKQNIHKCSLLGSCDKKPCRYVTEGPLKGSYVPRVGYYFRHFFLVSAAVVID